ncbi:hypothetical protein [Sinosporangium siamense]|nr:hypothetical protein [Sinosporangium siamense]
MNELTVRSTDQSDASTTYLSRVRLLLDAVPSAVLCRRTAAHTWGLRGQVMRGAATSWPIEVATNTDPGIAGCAVSPSVRPVGDITLHREFLVTTLDRTALDCARWLPRLEAVAILDQALRRGVHPDALRRRASLIYGAPGGRRVREMLALTDPRAGSPRESWVRVIVLDARLPRPTSQFTIPLSGGRTARLDLAWEDFKVAAEYDGHTRHTSDRDRFADERRRYELRELGWHVVPVRADVIPAHTAEFLTDIVNALLERGWHPSQEEMTRILAHIRTLRRPFLRR